MGLASLFDLFSITHVRLLLFLTLSIHPPALYQAPPSAASLDLFLSKMTTLRHPQQFSFTATADFPVFVMGCPYPDQLLLHIVPAQPVTLAASTAQCKDSALDGISAEDEPAPAPSAQVRAPSPPLTALQPSKKRRRTRHQTPVAHKSSSSTTSRSAATAVPPSTEATNPVFHLSPSSPARPPTQARRRVSSHRLRVPSTRSHPASNTQLMARNDRPALGAMRTNYENVSIGRCTDNSH
ncbi:uncharacterized protein EHS24_003587 [Apiotrichum porosum]|uniref:Uncharacterized protein n=1 Tax=Apiotrichum porosum TaxID=105984 RepID=A0A427XEK6_9TREE|nr:uncharacterized protein EHS24_003587 [Apiotrichum porosum]RSH77278.1 hypothetical protein EHS24_003587 [Apiotrichum porosum]